MEKLSGKRVINGTWGSMWLDGEPVAECYGLQAKFKYNKEKVALCGQMSTDTKTVSREGTGSLRMHKVNSRMATLVGDKVGRGEDVRFTIVTKLDDPDAKEHERWALLNVSFDDETIADWEAGKMGSVECPFTFTDREPL